MLGLKIYFEIISISNYSPSGHDLVLQSSVSDVEPEQAFPPFDGCTSSFR